MQKRSVRERGPLGGEHQKGAFSLTLQGPTRCAARSAPKSPQNQPSAPVLPMFFPVQKGDGPKTPLENRIRSVDWRSLQNQWVNLVHLVFCVDVPST